MVNLKCIDVSEWQGTIDWKKVKAAGYGYAILRAGFGRSASQKDKEFDKYYKNAKAAGVKLGAYWYSYAVDKADAVKEAKACLEVLRGKTFEMPVFFDMEENSMTKLGKSTLTEMAKVFCEEIKKGGFRPGVYSNPNWFTNYLNYTQLRALYPIWLAQYYKEAQFDCDVWQYSSTGAVNGVSGNVDLNIIYSESLVSEKKAVEKVNLETAGVQALLRQAYAQGLCKTFLKPIDNKLTDNVKKAVSECKVSIGYKETGSDVSLEFIKELEHKINVVRIEKEDKLKAQIKELQEKPVGDVNGDGQVNIKDATAIQKMIADSDE